MPTGVRAAGIAATVPQRLAGRVSALRFLLASSPGGLPGLAWFSSFPRRAFLACVPSRVRACARFLPSRPAFPQPATCPATRNLRRESNNTAKTQGRHRARGLAGSFPFAETSELRNSETGKERKREPRGAGRRAADYPANPREPQERPFLATSRPQAGPCRPRSALAARRAFLWLVGSSAGRPQLACRRLGSAPIRTPTSDLDAVGITVNASTTER